jgi:hypothetical protein
MLKGAFGGAVFPLPHRPLVGPLLWGREASFLSPGGEGWGEGGGKVAWAES